MKELSSNLTNKYNPQEHKDKRHNKDGGSNLTNKYNPQELNSKEYITWSVQILPINTILKNTGWSTTGKGEFKSYQ